MRIHLATNRAAFAVLAALALTLGSLASGCNKNGPPVTYSDVAQCGPGVEELIGDVTQILFANGGNPEPKLDAAARSQLAELALKYGIDAVPCVVDLLVNKRWTRPGATPHPERLKAVHRGREFLACPNEDACKPITIEDAGAP